MWEVMLRRGLGLSLLTGLECAGRWRKYRVAGCGGRLAGLGYVKLHRVQYVGVLDVEDWQFRY